MKIIKKRMMVSLDQVRFVGAVLLRDMQTTEDTKEERKRREGEKGKEGKKDEDEDKDGLFM